MIIFNITYNFNVITTIFKVIKHILLFCFYRKNRHAVQED